MRLLRFLSRTVAMAHKEVLHIVRDVWVVYLALAMPVVMLVLFGYAVTFDLNQLPLGVVDQDRSPASRQLVQAFTATDSFVVTAQLQDPAGIEPLFRQGRLKVALVIPPGYGRAVARGEPAEAQVLLDGADGTTTGIALGYAVGVGQAETRRLVSQGGQEIQLAIQDAVRFRFNPGMRSAQFIVPGLIALILAILAVLLTALTVAREWERGSMEQLFATPVGRLEVILGKLAPYTLLGLLQVLLVLTLGAYLFDLPVRGSVGLVFLAALVFLLGMLAQGVLISVVTKHQQLATQVGFISSMLPALLLSGFIIPVENMPRVLQYVASVVPARYFIRCLRGIMLKGNDLTVVWPDIAAMALYAVVVIAAANARFRRRLD
jgi:ABC-2 type transport system permease protein